MNDIIRLTLQASIVAQIVLLILLYFTFISWSVIIEKFRLLRKVSKESKRFINMFNANDGWEQLYRQCQVFKYSPFARLFKTAYQEFSTRNNRPIKREIVFQQPQTSGAAVTEKQNRTDLSGTLHSTAAREMKSLEESLIFLATTASASPFLGLFGTVWGVMNAFLSFGPKEFSELSIVGPGIAEALVTTAAGLAVAIPALIAYNYFSDRLRRLDGDLQYFAGELIRLKEKESAL